RRRRKRSRTKRPRRRRPDGSGIRHCDRRARRGRSLAAAAAENVTGDHGAVAVVVRDEPFHLRHGASRDAAAADPHGRDRQPRALHRSRAASARADRDRDRLRVDGALPRRIARAARPVGHGSRRRPGARAMSTLLDHLPILPIVVPLFAGASMLLLGESRRTLRNSIALGSLGMQLAVALVLLYQTTDAAAHIWT